MNNYYAMFLIGLAIFIAGAIIGVKTYHPVDMVHYKAFEDLISECNEKNGKLKVEDNRANCSITEVIFSKPLNTSYFDTSYSQVD
jgi:hypothetical protein